MAEPPTPYATEEEWRGWLDSCEAAKEALRARLAEAERQLADANRDIDNAELHIDFLRLEEARYREALERIAKHTVDYQAGLAANKALAGVDVPKGPLFHNVEQSGVRVDVPKGPEDEWQYTTEAITEEGRRKLLAERDRDRYREALERIAASRSSDPVREWARVALAGGQPEAPGCECDRLGLSMTAECVRPVPCGRYAAEQPEAPKGRPRPDYDPHLDHPERFTEGPV